MYYYGARYYDPRISIFVSVDPLAEEFPNYGGYNYTLNNPINFVDTDGRYPRPLLIFNSEKGSYKFTRSAVHLLHLVSGVSKTMIESTTVMKRAPYSAVPAYNYFSYSHDEGGGAITLGENSYSSRIIFTENYFHDDPDAYEGNGFGADIFSWLDLASHEVGHIPQIGRHNGQADYLMTFVKQYSKSGHDDAPYEIEAEKGTSVFRDFKKFTDKTYGKNSLIKLFQATEKKDGRKGTETYKIKTIR